MQVSNADVSSLSLLVNSATDAFRENPQGRHAVNAEEEAKVEELKAQDAAVQQLQQAAVKDVGAAEGSARADDENKEEGSQREDAEEKENLSYAEVRYQVERELARLQAGRVRFFDRKGHVTKPGSDPSRVNLLG